MPRVGSGLPALSAVQLFVLQRVVGPWRRRFWRTNPPPPPLTGPQTLQRLVDLPVNYWTYEFEPGVRHVGPMAQDFAASFGLGRTNRMINSLDASGITIASVQALHRRVARLEAEVQQLHTALDQKTPPPP